MPRRHNQHGHNAGRRNARTDRARTKGRDKLGRPKQKYRPRYGDAMDGVVERLGDFGDGIVQPLKDGEAANGNTVFVPGCLPGETIRFNPLIDPRNPDQPTDGRIMEVLEPSSDRVDAACQHFGDCGGCRLQHVSPSAIGDFKAQRLRQALSQKGLDPKLVKPTEAAWGAAAADAGARRRMEFTLRNDGSHVRLGLHRHRSKVIVDLAECPVADPAISGQLEDIRAFAKATLWSGEAADLHITSCDNGLDLVLTRSRSPSLDERQDWPSIIETHDWARLSWRPDHQTPPETVIARREPIISVEGIPVPLPPGGFIQATTAGQAALIKHLLAALDQYGVKTDAPVIDLFSGMGTFTIPMAVRGHRVHAVDGNGDALQALQAAAGQRFASRVKVEQRDLFQHPLEDDLPKDTAAVILDPPRAGCQMQATALAEREVPLIIMISCNPVTFARDAGILVEGGYHIGQVQPIDQFQWSPETELIATFSRSPHQ